MNMTIVKNITRCLAVAALAGAGFWQAAHAALPIEHWQQDSGASVYFVHSPAIPIVDVQVDFDAGSRRDPQDRAGLAGVTASMVSKGVQARDGAPALDENQLGEAWADLGANFGASASEDRMSFRLRSLSEAQILQKAVALAARQMGAPSFPDEVWQRERERMGASLREALTRPGTVAALAYARAVYGTHPYGFETTPQTLAAIDTADMRAFYERTIRPCAAKVSVVGAISRDQADALAGRLLSQLPQQPCTPPLPEVPQVQPLKAAEDIRIPFDSAQAHVLLGQPGYRRDDPDYFALMVGNYTLGGGGFASRMMREVREKRGLSYGAYSSFSPGLHAGAFTVQLQTRPDQAQLALDTAREVVQGFVEEGPTEDELKAARDYLTGSFALRLDSNSKLLGNVANIAWNNLPLDYLDTWTDRINAVTAAEVRAAFQRVLQPQRMVSVIVGGRPPAPATTPAAGEDAAASAK